MKKTLTFFVLLFVFFAATMASPYINYNAQISKNKNINARYAEDTDLGVKQPEKISDKNILVLGIDSRKSEPSRSDVMIVLNFKEDRIIFVSIPRDSQISLKNKGRIKINSAYTIGGIELSKKIVESLLDINIDNYLVLNFNAIKNGVDALGGFTVTIPKDIKIADPELKKKFILKKGTHKLNGIQTLEYLRYRNDGKGDLARLYRQQQFVKDLQQSFLKTENIPLIPRAYMVIRDDIKTDMSASDMANYFIQGQRQKDNFEYHTLEGHGKTIDKVSYFILDKEQLNEIRKLLKNDS